MNVYGERQVNKVAVYDGFFDAVLDESGNYDRTYNSSDFTGYFGEIIGSGVCVYNNPDSMLVRYENGNAVVAPGYLFIRGYWLKNDADYYVPVDSSGAYVILAHLNMGGRMIEIIAQEKAETEVYTDSLVLAYITDGAVEDARYNADICGVIDAMGELSDKVKWAINYINNEVDTKIEQAEASIAKQSALLDAKIDEVNKELDRLAPPPIGTIKFSASQNIEEGWLRCDGSFVNEADYPELVEALGKYTPGIKDFSEISKGEIPRDISNGVISEGRFWVFSFSAMRLIGLSLTNHKDIKKISITGANLLYSPTIQPIYLSIIEGKYLFLTQRKELGAPYVYKTYKFDSNSTTVSLEQFSWPLLKKDKGDSYIYAPTADINTAYYVVKNDLLFYMALGTYIEQAGHLSDHSYVQYITWDLNDNVSEYPVVKEFTSDINVVYTHDIYPYVTDGVADDIGPTQWFIGGVKGFSKKTNNEMIYGNGRISSIPKKSYSIDVKSKNNVSKQVILTSMGLVSGNQSQCLARIYKPLTSKDIRIAYIIQSVRADEITFTLPSIPNIALNFMDASVYITELNIWLIFLGSGILFTDDLQDKTKYGFLDTTETLGVISQFGYMEYDTSTKKVYILGQDTNNIVKLGELQLPTLFEYASDGVWLPMISSDGVPAYIKAKET